MLADSGIATVRRDKAFFRMTHRPLRRLPEVADLDRNRWPTSGRNHWPTSSEYALGADVGFPIKFVGYSRRSGHGQHRG